ncbi:MAG: aminoglycoside phosphotransferase [Nitrospira sp.]|nr:aminoglycoside phosphotransferase [Nitrospira sp.]
MATLDPAQPKIALAPPDRARVARTVETHLHVRAALIDLVALPGDASNRCYFRLMLSGNRSVILMQLAEPETFKQSEEAVSGAVAVTELPFLNVHRRLVKAGVTVPTLHYYDQEAGLLYLEDFGDALLVQACDEGRSADTARYYRRAIDMLVRIHSKATSPADDQCIAFHRAFDVPLLMWEFDHFLEYGVGARHGKPMCADDFQPVRDVFQQIAELIAGQPRLFTHRDYHSRNLIVEGDRLGVIDFQDALMGPAAYDLASLLRDAYIVLEESLVDALIAAYLDGMAKAGMDLGDRMAFRRVFDLTSLQRNLKAAGRFVYIDRVKKNSKFLADIPRVLGYVRRNLAKYPELFPLRKHLAPYVLELR